MNRFATSLINYIRYAVYLIVFIGFFPAAAGSYDDFFTAIAQDDGVRIKQLLKRGFDSNTISPTGVHGLVLAIRTPSPRAIQTLLDAPGIAVEVRTLQDESPLMLAALAGMNSVCERLIALNADVNKTGWTPLHYAASRSQVDTVRLLLSHFAYVDAESPNRTTPLMMAAMYGDTATVQALLDAGADASLLNDKNMSAVDFSVQGGKEDSARLIGRYLTKQGTK